MGTMKVLVVAGGGGGGYAGGASGGGGGAGGLLYNATFAVTSQSYTVTVGDGGIAASSHLILGIQGGNSVFDTLTAIGGGRGGNRVESDNNGGAGGSGGGGGTYNFNSTGGTATVGQGNAGGGGLYNPNKYVGGGGGGAGAIGGTGSGTVAGSGGIGISNDITGSATYYAGGGGGGTGIDGTVAGIGGLGGGGTGERRGFAVATPGVDGLGGGGGGQSVTVSVGHGGSGVVIISYVTADYGVCTGGTVTIDGLNTIHKFTTSGIFTVVEIGSGIMAPGNYATLFDGLVAGYDFKGDAKDFSGNANDGTVTGATLVADKFGITNSVYSCDGINDIISLNQTLSSVVDTTIITMVKFEIGNADVYYLNAFNNQVHNRWAFFQGAGNALMFLGTGSLTNTLDSGIDLKDGLWHTVAWTYNNSTDNNIMYIDGLPVANVVGNTNSTNTIVIGRVSGGTTLTYGPVTMSSVYIFNAEKSADEVKTFHNLIFKQYIYPYISEGRK